jgi:hypothetical protein
VFLVVSIKVEYRGMPNPFNHLPHVLRLARVHVTRRYERRHALLSPASKNFVWQCTAYAEETVFGEAGSSDQRPSARPDRAAWKKSNTVVQGWGAVQ